MANTALKVLKKFENNQKRVQKNLIFNLIFCTHLLGCTSMIHSIVHHNLFTQPPSNVEKSTFFQSGSRHELPKFEKKNRAVRILVIAMLFKAKYLLFL